jgi:hypothetical protein
MLARRPSAENSSAQAQCTLLMRRLALVQHHAAFLSLQSERQRADAEGAYARSILRASAMAMSSVYAFLPMPAGIPKTSCRAARRRSLQQRAPATASLPAIQDTLL